MMRRLDRWMRSIQFGFNEVDATLNGWEMLGSLVLGAAICSAPFIIKALLSIYF